MARNPTTWQAREFRPTQGPYGQSSCAEMSNDTREILVGCSMSSGSAQERTSRCGESLSCTACTAAEAQHRKGSRLASSEPWTVSRVEGGMPGTVGATLEGEGRSLELVALTMGLTVVVLSEKS